MRTLSLTLLSVFALASALFLSSCDKDHKVKVCHKGNIILVDFHAVPAHKGHGDAVDLDCDGYFDIDNACSEVDCDDTNPQVNPGAEPPNDCSADACSITAFQVLNATCTDPTNTYDLQLRITYANAPATGMLNVTIDGTLFPFAIGTSPQTVNAFGLPPTGVGVDVTASFSDDPTCQLVVNDLYEAPDCGL
jgi:hypothetical protein